ncbi:MAG: ABC transporter permease, partial [Anaerolineae bacterium]|nr:ABC transporter permease [Anaerolineae bacterium]
LTYAGLTAQARRAELGVLRALGLSSRRVVGGLALEQVFVMITGAVLGAILGWTLAAQVVPTLALGAAGEGITPPFVVRIETRRLIEYALLMVGVFGLVLVSSLVLVRQLALARALRLGDE